jgi:hypothetical protein
MWAAAAPGISTIWASAFMATSLYLSPICPVEAIPAARPAERTVALRPGRSFSLGRSLLENPVSSRSDPLDPPFLLKSAQGVVNDILALHRPGRGDAPFFDQVVLKIQDGEFGVSIQQAVDFAGPLNPVLLDPWMNVSGKRLSGFPLPLYGGQRDLDEAKLFLVKPALPLEHFDDFGQ